MPATILMKTNLTKSRCCSKRHRREKVGDCVLFPKYILLHGPAILMDSRISCLDLMLEQQWIDKRHSQISRFCPILSLIKHDIVTTNKHSYNEDHQLFESESLLCLSGQQDVSLFPMTNIHSSYSFLRYLLK